MNTIIGLLFGVLSMFIASESSIDQNGCFNYDDSPICQTLFVNCTATAAENLVNGDYTHGMYMEFTYNICPNAYNDCMDDTELEEA